jgi:superfamily II DNA/RNA helicase
MFDAHGHRRKLVLFTEHRDTLNYLAERIRALLGKPEAVVTIHGGVGREERKKAQEAFTQDKEVEILVATDAAGEGINLQRAHLMVNYDLPWNPNRLEQRFGRIHRIGQTEVCHLWNLVARETREGEVFLRLLEKLDEERQALGGRVFDVLGQLRFEDRPLRELLLEAVRYGDRPEVRARLYEVVDKALDREHLRELVEGRALAHDAIVGRPGQRPPQLGPGPPAGGRADLAPAEAPGRAGAGAEAGATAAGGARRGHDRPGRPAAPAAGEGDGDAAHLRR